MLPSPITDKDPVYPHTHNVAYTGITYREYYAGLALQGFLASRVTGPITAMAVGVADQLIKDLNKDPSQLAAELGEYMTKATREMEAIKAQMKAQHSAQQKERT